MKLSLCSLAVLALLVVGHDTKPVFFTSSYYAFYYDSSAITKTGLLSRGVIQREILIANRDYFANPANPGVPPNGNIAKEFDGLDNQVKMIMKIIVTLDKNSLQLGAHAVTLDKIDQEKNLLISRYSHSIPYVAVQKQPTDQLLMQTIELYQLVEKNINKFAKDQNIAVTTIFQGHEAPLEKLMAKIVSLDETNVLEVELARGELKNNEDEVHMLITTNQGVDKLITKSDLVTRANELLRQAKEYAAKFTTDASKTALANIPVLELESFIKTLNVAADTVDTMGALRQHLDYIEQGFNALKKQLGA